MARRGSALRAVALAIGLAAQSGCWEDVADAPDETPRTGIRGEVRLAPQGALDAARTRVAAYAGRAAFDAGDAIVTVAPVASSVPNGAAAFALELPAGDYFIDGWMDAQADGEIDAGDLYAFHRAAGSPVPALVQVMAGHETDLVLTLEPVLAQRAFARLSRAKFQSIR